MTIDLCDLASEITEWASSSSRFFLSCLIRRYMLDIRLEWLWWYQVMWLEIPVKKIGSYLILFLSADDDLESFEVAENIEPNDFAPSDRAENIDFMERPDSDLNEANEIVSPAIEPGILYIRVRSHK